MKILWSQSLKESSTVAAKRTVNSIGESTQPCLTPFITTIIHSIRISLYFFFSGVKFQKKDSDTAVGSNQNILRINIVFAFHENFFFTCMSFDMVSLLTSISEL